MLLVQMPRNLNTPDATRIFIHSKYVSIKVINRNMRRDDRTGELITQEVPILVQ